MVDLNIIFLNFIIQFDKCLFIIFDIHRIQFPATPVEILTVVRMIFIIPNYIVNIGSDIDSALSLYKILKQLL